MDFETWTEGAPPQEYFRLAAYGPEPAPWEIETPQPAVMRAVGPGGVLANHIGPGARVLDLCCGVGRHSVLLAGKGCDVVGVDMADIALQRARRHWEQTQAQAGQEGQRGSATFMPCDLLAPDTWIGAMLTPFDLVVDTAAFHCFAKEQWPQYMEAWRRATRPGSRILFLNFAYVFPIPPILAWRGLDTVNMRGSRLANAFAPASRGMTNASNWRRDPPGYPGIGPLHIAEAELRTAIFTPDNGWEIETLEMSEYFHTGGRGDPRPQPAWLVVARRV